MQPKVKEHKILKTATMYDLDLEINALLKLGWVLRDPLIVIQAVSPWYAQAMVLYETEVKS